MKLSHLNSLRALEATLRHGSFTVAADELGISPAAVGQRVRALENYIGKSLFDRTGTGIVPLEEARNVEKQLTSGFSSIAGGLEQLKQDEMGNRVSVTLPASFAENWLMPFISEFYSRHLEIDLRLDASNRDVDLLTEDFDFAIRYGQPVVDPLQEILLFGDYVLPVCSPEFVQQYDLQPQSRSLKGVPLIHMMNRTSDPSWVGFEGWGSAFGFLPEGLDLGVRYSKISSGLQSAIRGQGLVICGLTEAYNSIQSGNLVMPFGPSLRLPTHYQYRLIWVSRRRMSPLQADFKDWILQRASIFVEESSRLLSENEVH